MSQRSVNKCIFIGSLGKDAEVKFTPSGACKTSFSLALGHKWKDKTSGDWKEETTWANIILWNGESLSNYLLKGKQVYVEGRLSTRSYEGNDGTKKYITEIVADNVILLGGGGSREPREVTVPVDDDWQT
jgi:single-strand DNA-binding protein